MRRLWWRLADWCVPARALDLPTWEWKCFYPAVKVSGIAPPTRMADEDRQAFLADLNRRVWGQ